MRGPNRTSWCGTSAVLEADVSCRDEYSEVKRVWCSEMWCTVIRLKDLGVWDRSYLTDAHCVTIKSEDLNRSELERATERECEQSTCFDVIIPFSVVDSVLCHLVTWVLTYEDEGAIICLPTDEGIT